jgi:hypothetical protein
LKVPLTVVMLREGSFALTSFGRVRNSQERTFAVAGRQSFALKRILETIDICCLDAAWLTCLVNSMQKPA